MAILKWDAIGERKYELGVDHGILFVFDNGAYKNGVVFNGLTSVQESPDGAEANDIWADNMKYGSIRSAENFKGTIEAYMYPPEFAECDGSITLVKGVTVTQQTRKHFGLAYRSNIGSDTTDWTEDYRIHLVYGATVSPSEQNHETVNDSPEPGQFSWEFDTVPVPVSGYRNTAHIYVTKSECELTKFKAFEDYLIGTATTESQLPLPDKLKELFT
nr:MAG TPA: tail tube protein [Caudoviricetes sp.]